MNDPFDNAIETDDYVEMVAQDRGDWGYGLIRVGPIEVPGDIYKYHWSVSGEKRLGVIHAVSKEMREDPVCLVAKLFHVLELARVHERQLRAEEQLMQSIVTIKRALPSQNVSFTAAHHPSWSCNIKGCAHEATIDFSTRVLVIPVAAYKTKIAEAIPEQKEIHFLASRLEDQYIRVASPNDLYEDLRTWMEAVVRSRNLWQQIRAIYDRCLMLIEGRRLSDLPLYVCPSDFGILNDLTGHQEPDDRLASVERLVDISVTKFRDTWVHTAAQSETVFYKTQWAPEYFHSWADVHAEVLPGLREGTIHRGDDGVVAGLVQG